MSDLEVVRQGLAEQVYAALEKAVVGMEFEPGSRLVIDQLADRMGVSATPVREALGKLAGVRLVEVTPYQGFRMLPESTAAELEASFEARRAIEEFATRVGSQRATDADIEALRESADRIAERRYSGSVESYLEFLGLNQQFHERVVGLAQNQYLLEAAKSLFHEAVIARTLKARGVPDLDRILEEHETIVKAVEARDSDAAVAAVLHHASAGSERILKFVWGAKDDS